MDYVTAKTGEPHSEYEAEKNGCIEGTEAEMVFLEAEAEMESGKKEWSTPVIRLLDGFPLQ